MAVTTVKMSLTVAEAALIKLLRSTPYGEITIKMRDGKPYMVLEYRRDFKLDA